MYFDNLNELINMGGYARFVWTAYGITLFILICNYVEPIIGRKKIILYIKHKHERRVK